MMHTPHPQQRRRPQQQRTGPEDKVLVSPMQHYDMRSWWAKQRGGATGDTSSFGDGSLPLTIGDAISVANGMSAKYDADLASRGVLPPDATSTPGAGRHHRPPMGGFSTEVAVERGLNANAFSHAGSGRRDAARRSHSIAGKGRRLQTPPASGHSPIAEQVAVAMRQEAEGPPSWCEVFVPPPSRRGPLRPAGPASFR